MQVLPNLLFKVPFCCCTVYFECTFFICKCLFPQNFGIPHTHNFVSHINFFTTSFFGAVLFLLCVQIIFFTVVIIGPLIVFVPVLFPLLFAVALYYFYAALVQ